MKLVKSIAKSILSPNMYRKVVDLKHLISWTSVFFYSKIVSPLINEVFLTDNTKMTVMMINAHAITHTAGFQCYEINRHIKDLDDCYMFSFSYEFRQKNELCNFYHLYMNYFRYLKYKSNYVKFFDVDPNKFFLLERKRKYEAKVGYSIFLNVTYQALEVFENSNIPFIFTLYPGGGFCLDNPTSDKMLTEIFNSKMFRYVIVTMSITKEYLLKKNFCIEDKIVYLYGGFIENSDIGEKIKYLKNKDTFDICFVAHQYTETGADKGLDVFLKVVELLEAHSEIKFHVVGDWSKYLSTHYVKSKNITFYGFQNKDFFEDFYLKMDIYFGGTKVSGIFPGNFDGYPLGCQSMLKGVALFAMNPLRIESPFKDGVDIIEIDNNPEKIKEKIIYYMNNTDLLYKISESGKETCKHAMNPIIRIKLIQDILLGITN